MSKLIVKQDPEKPVPHEILAQQIGAMADGFVKLTKGGLSRRAIVVLIQDACPQGDVSKKQINQVLDALRDLRTLYIEKPV